MNKSIFLYSRIFWLFFLIFLGGKNKERFAYSIDRVPKDIWDRWEKKREIEYPVKYLAFMDIDGDGKEEMIVKIRESAEKANDKIYIFGREEEEFVYYGKLEVSTSKIGFGVMKWKEYNAVNK